MSTIRNISILSLLILTTISCGQKAFPVERFIFDSTYRSLVTPYHVGDTLYFENRTGTVSRIKITGIDSSISNTRGGFMSPRPYKDIQVYCDNLDYHRANSKDTILVLINILPDSFEQSGNFSLMNFRGGIGNGTDSLILEFQPEPGILFKNCFVIRNRASDLGEGPNDVEYLYVQQDAGIIAFKTYSGDWWFKR